MHSILRLSASAAEQCAALYYPVEARAIQWGSDDSDRFYLDISKNGAIDITIVSVDVTSCHAGSAMNYPVERAPSSGEATILIGSLWTSGRTAR